MTCSCFDKKFIYILDAVRTAIGSPFKSLKDFSVGELGGFVAAALLKRSKLVSGIVDEMILGNTVMAGAGQNPARQAGYFAGLVPETTAYTVNEVCGAGLQSVILASQSIGGGFSNCIIAGGAESASRTPQLFSKSVELSYSERQPVDSLLYDGLWCNLSGKFMGEICEEFARKEKISRVEQDRYALESHQKAGVGKFRAEIIDVLLADKSVFCQDERIRHKVSLENFKILPSSFSVNGTVTPGNASVPSDGAAAILVAGEDFVCARRVKPLARILGYASVGLKPQNVFMAAVPAITACLKICGLKLSDIDLFEISEAFAAQAIFTRNTLNISAEKMNIYGGDIALGHPLGAAGTRILVTLVHALQVQNKKYGLAAICYGGGGAMAVIVTNERKN